MSAKVSSLWVRGFRAYGASPQTLNLSKGTTAVWGPNSTGKSSLAEAFEFLLTGRIVRRELLASSVDEFADAIRNAHLPRGDEVLVSARVVADDGTEHELRRVLVADYSKKRACTSRLQIDGSPGRDEDLTRFGFTFSEPPLRAPVLTQDTLSYVFSARPVDRATYFKTLLEVTDLDDLRKDIASLTDRVRANDAAILQKLQRCAKVAALGPAFGPVWSSLPDCASLVGLIGTGAQAILEAAGVDAPDVYEEKLRAIKGVLADRRRETFPVDWLTCGEIRVTPQPDAKFWLALDSYQEEKGRVDQETRELTQLFAVALQLPSVAELQEPADCPLCAAPSTLTPNRVQTIREHVSATGEFKKAEKAARDALVELRAEVEGLGDADEAALPRHLRTTRNTRRKAGFTSSRIRELLEDGDSDLLESWFVTLRPLARARADVAGATRDAAIVIRQQIDGMSAGVDPDVIRNALRELAECRERLIVATRATARAAKALLAALTETIDAEADTVGWQEFLDVANDVVGLHDALVEREARTRLSAELGAALKQIDRAKERVLDDKFTDYSDLVQEWWERLRPEEPTYFSSVGPRTGTVRTIDFKAGLAPDSDRSGSIVRDVIAVFSQSQLHCLGLALFLARVQHEGLGFIVLDDPVLSSDDDYRVHFQDAVVGALQDLDVQTVVLTQNHDTWKDLENLYRHVGILTAQLIAASPAEGSIIENTSDGLTAKISRARVLARGGHPFSRKECGLHLRDAGERFCKEMLVNDARTKGQTKVSLSDYDGKMLEWLCPRVSPLLDKDASHPGKLRVFKDTVNQACHDNTPPETNTMVHACGEIAFLQKIYLPL